MNLKELIEALTKLETVCGGATETEAVGVGLSIKTEIKSAQPYGRWNERDEKRIPINSITVQVIEKDAPNNGCPQCPSSEYRMGEAVMDRLK